MGGGKKKTSQNDWKVYRTAVFKLHNPSRQKRAMLRDCMRRAHLSYSRLLTDVMPPQDKIKHFASLPKADRQQELRTLEAKVVKLAQNIPHLALSARDGNRVDVLAQIKSTIGLQNEQEEVGFATVNRINDSTVPYSAALDEIAVVTDRERIDELSAQLFMLAKAGRFRPLNFPRHSTTSGFALFRAPQTNRVYAWLNLHPRHASRAKKYKTPPLIDLKTGEERSFSSETGALFPLECGKDFHEHGFVDQGEPMTARLFHRRERCGLPCDEFELHVTFKFIVPKHTPITWMGIDRGVYNLAAYAVIDSSGRLTEGGRISGMNLRLVQRKIERATAQEQAAGRRAGLRQRRAYAEEAVHVAANSIVDIASKHRAQVVIEDLRSFAKARAIGRAKGQRRSSFNKLFNRTQYEKLRRVLEYKLKIAGLPMPIRVRAAFTSQTCPECGHKDPENRKKTQGADMFEMDKFACVKCGFASDADENAARVIALKAIWLRGLPRKAEREEGRALPGGLKFEKFLADKKGERLRLGA